MTTPTTEPTPGIAVIPYDHSRLSYLLPRNHHGAQTIATQSYLLSFRQFQFGQGAALGNILIVISLVFAVFYVRATRRAVDE